jgi:hypothetical protein
MSGKGRTRVAEDEHGRRATYEEIEVGAALESFEWVVSEDDIEKQCRLDEDYHEWYVLESPWGGRVAPPQIQYRPPRWQISRSYNLRGVFYKWEFENVKPIRPGVSITIGGRILDKWIKNDREFVKFESVGTDAEGDVVFRTTRVHALDMIKRTAPRKSVGIDSGIKRERI